MPKKLTKDEQYEIDHFWNRYESFLYWRERDSAEAAKLWDEIMGITGRLIEMGIIQPGDRMPPQGK